MQQQQIAAEDRCEQRRHRHDERHIGEDLHAAAALVEVADDGAGEDRPGAGADPLHETPQHELGDAAAQRAADPAGGEQRQANEERRPAAETIGERTINQLAGRIAGEKHAQAQRGLVGTHREHRRQGRQSSQAHIDRQRGQPGQGAEQDHERA